MTLYDKEKNSWNRDNNNKRKLESVSETTDSPKPTTTFSLQKKIRKESSLNPESTDTARVSSVMPVSQESEKSTSRLKKDQQCMLLADKLTDGAVMKTMTEIVEKYLNDDQKLDNTLSRYIKFTKEDQPQASQHQNIHNLFFGDKEDIYHLVEIEGWLKTYFIKKKKVMHLLKSIIFISQSTW